MSCFVSALAAGHVQVPCIARHVLRVICIDLPWQIGTEDTKIVQPQSYVLSYSLCL